MKLISYERNGEARVGVVEEGRVTDAGTSLFDLHPGDEVGGIDDVRVLAPVPRPGKIVCVGLNYRDHAKESGAEVPSEPVIFMKATSAIVGPNDDLIIPKGSTKTDWEVELAVVIGAKASYVDEARAMDHVAGYALHNDYSERAFQLERGGQWVKGKSADTFGPIGPWLVTTDEVPAWDELDMWL
ncbi:MAG: 2,4-didehydro-3-deoxy-L-rhamnonate hydrolase, partial [Acidimicrobiaceae bacterium]|nr:2,4-didehydro-3-deoxy-L-rhamnonate hydrolase [Acidimicrobiaceae bacterium]